MVSSRKDNIEHTSHNPNPNPMSTLIGEFGDLVKSDLPVYQLGIVQEP
jgi:hypothetical protein